MQMIMNLKHLIHQNSNTFHENGKAFKKKFLIN